MTIVTTYEPAVGQPQWASCWTPVDIDRHRNNVGITSPDTVHVGGFNVWGNSLPVGELPCGRDVVVAGTPYAFPAAGRGQPDNVRCDGQHVPVPEGRYSWVHVLGAGERRVEDELVLHFADGSVDLEGLRLSDFWHATAAFGEVLAFQTASMHYPHHVQKNVKGTVWSQRVPVARRAALVAIGLPRNLAAHVFAVTLEADRTW